MDPIIVTWNDLLVANATVSNETVMEVWATSFTGKVLMFLPVVEIVLDAY